MNLPTLVPIRPSLSCVGDIVPLFFFANGPLDDDDPGQRVGVGTMIVCDKSCFLVTARHVAFETEQELKDRDRKAPCPTELWFPRRNVVGEGIIWTKILCEDGLIHETDLSLDLVLFPSEKWKIFPASSRAGLICCEFEKVASPEFLKETSPCEEVAMFCFPIGWDSSKPLSPFIRYGRTSFSLSVIHTKYTGFTSITTLDGDSGAPVFLLRPAGIRMDSRNNIRTCQEEFYLLGFHTDAMLHEAIFERANISGFIFGHHIRDILERNISLSQLASSKK